MNKTIALALYEFKGRINLKADFIGLVLICFLLVSRLFTGYFVEESVPTNLGILYNGIDNAVYVEIESVMDKMNIPIYKIEEVIKLKLKSGTLDAYLSICIDCEIPTIRVHSIGQFTAINYLNTIKATLEPIILPHFYGISGDMYKMIESGIDFVFVESDKDTYQQFLTLNTLFMILTIVGVLSSFALLLQGITEEKDSKVTLMYMSCMKVSEWIDSKVLAATFLSLKSFITYLVLAGVGLHYFGVLELSNEDWTYFIQNKLPYLAITFAVGYTFWCYLFALISSLINDPNSPIKSAAVMIPMTAFGIVLSLLDFVSADFFGWLNYLPFTYLFTLSASVVLTEFDTLSFILCTCLTLVLTLFVRSLAIRFVKFETIQ